MLTEWELWGVHNMLKTTSRKHFLSNKRSVSRRQSRGFSIVEMLVGVAIGLFVLSSASLIFVGNITNSRLLLIQTRIDQDLHSTMDLITRDLRRGAYWVNSLTGTTTTGSAATANPYSAVAITGITSAPEIDYLYANSTDDSSVATRTFGFKLNSATNAIQMNLGSANWQTLTDTNIVSINTFTITPTVTTIDISAACPKTCTGSTCPSVTVRTYNIVLIGTSKIDSAVTRTLRSQIRVRNDALAGTCPV